MEAVEKKDFYFEFEKKYRGSRKLIKDRQRVYIPFALECKNLHSNCEVFDIGCGRGEWLELLGENGISARGCDLDDDMITFCTESGFSVEKNDALKALKTLPDESVSIVSGFHIAEHVPFEILQEIVRESKRVLKPSGLLILETPNPENLVVGSCNFYTDPSHNRPLPPSLLSFLPEFNDFYRVKIFRLKEDKSLRDAKVVSLFQAITGTSPDYSIIAQKEGLKENLAKFDELFKKDYGLKLWDLCALYDQTIRSDFESCVSEHFSSLQEKCSDHEGRLGDHEGRLGDHEGRIADGNARLSQQEQTIARQEAIISEQARQIEDLRSRLDSTYNLLMNTRHRTLYGALAWLWHKVFKRR